MISPLTLVAFPPPPTGFIRGERPPGRAHGCVGVGDGDDDDGDAGENRRSRARGGEKASRPLFHKGCGDGRRDLMALPSPFSVCRRSHLNW